MIDEELMNETPSVVKAKRKKRLSLSEKVANFSHEPAKKTLVPVEKPKRRAKFFPALPKDVSPKVEAEMKRRFWLKLDTLAMPLALDYLLQVVDGSHPVIQLIDLTEKARLQVKAAEAILKQRAKRAEELGKFAPDDINWKGIIVFPVTQQALVPPKKDGESQEL